MRKKKIFIICVPLIVLLTVYINVTVQAWFVYTARDSFTGKLGALYVSTEAQTTSLLPLMRGANLMSPAAYTEPSAAAVVTFTVTNRSSVDTFMRIAWTPVYRDDDGNPVAKDVSGFTITGCSITVPAGAGASAETSPVGKRNKDFIYLQDNGGYYYVIPANTNVTGSFTLTGDTHGLDVIVSAEAIQASPGAILDAVEWGWQCSRVKGGVNP